MAMLAVPGLVLLSNPSSSQTPPRIVRASARPYAGAGARVLRMAALSRRVPVPAPKPVSTTEPPTTEAPSTSAAPRAATTTTDAPTTTVKPRPTTTTEAPPPAAAAAGPVVVAANVPSSVDSSSSETQGGATLYEAPAGTCAHRTLPFGTVVTVTRVATGASTTCRVADRGPFVSGMIIDLSMETFAEIASTDDGIIQVQLSW